MEKKQSKKSTDFYYLPNTMQPEIFTYQAQVYLLYSSSFNTSSSFFATYGIIFHELIIHPKENS